MPKFLVFFYFLFFSFLCYSQQNNIDSLERQLNKSDISEIVRTLNLLSVRLFDTLPVKALLYAEEAMKLAEQQNNQEGKMVALKNIGLVYKHQKENKKAIEFFMQSLELSQRLQNTSECAKISRELGFCYQNVSENDKAIEFLIASLSFPNMSQKNKLSIDEFFSKGSVYNKLSEIYIQKNDYKNAYNYSQLYQSLMDSIRNEKNQNQLDEMIGKYESEKQLYKIDIQKIELEKK
jgi:tetratricopeptide (TPR) repeat protein